MAVGFRAHVALICVTLAVALAGLYGEHAACAARDRASRVLLVGQP